VPAVSIVIVNYNTRDDLRLCLESLRCSSAPAEVIVVDNASSDGSADMVRAAFPEVRLIEPGHNTWYCGGNNLGIDAARGDYVLLLNPDTIVQPGSVGTMLSYLASRPDYAGVTMQLRYGDGGIQRTCSRKTTYRHLLLTQSVLTILLPWLRRRAERHHWYDDWKRDCDYDVETVPGSCTLMRRADLRYDERLLLYFPEDDLARRLNGRKFRFLATPHITHREKSATKSWRGIALYYRDMLVFTRTHFGIPAMALLWLLSRPLYWGMALRWHISPPSDAQIRRESS
jgi:hypothetical protein